MWNYGDILDVVAARVRADAPAFIHEDRVILWPQAYQRMNNLARAIMARGGRASDKVAFYLRNCPEYSEAAGASFLGRFVHVNVNYRYKPDEVRYILDNSDAQCLIYAREFRDCIAEIRHSLPKLMTYIEVGEEPVADFAVPYESLVENGDGAPLGIKRSPEDLLFIYTGGTTGMPKGVMWPHGELCTIWLRRIKRTLGFDPQSLEEYGRMIALAGAGSRNLPACPLMHGTGFITAITTMLGGGCVVTVDNHHFDPHAIWQAVERHKIQGMAVVGDPFARPLLQALDEAPGRYDVSSLLTMTSSGAMWSMEVKRGLLQHMPQLTMTDSFASTEAMGMGDSVVNKDGETRTAAFHLLENAIVIDEHDRPLAAGSGKAGLVALGGPLPVGYYKDPEKTARTFRTIGNRRYSIPGDWARLEADGSITLLGRGSNCINTAGEKVYPEEVEEALKTHPGVEDALVIGVPDDKWGAAVTGVVKLAPGVVFDEDALRAHVRQHLAGYKTPKRIVPAEIALRAPNGKADYKSVSEFARKVLNIAS